MGKGVLWPSEQAHGQRQRHPHGLASTGNGSVNGATGIGCEITDETHDGIRDHGIVRIRFDIVQGMSIRIAQDVNIFFMKGGFQRIQMIIIAKFMKISGISVKQEKFCAIGPFPCRNKLNFCWNE